MNNLKSTQGHNYVGLWERLNEEEKNEILLSFGESEKDENLIPKKAFFDSIKNQSPIRKNT